MSKELRHSILNECIKQHDISMPHDDYDVATDFRMAAMELEGGNEVELFKLVLKNGLRKNDEQRT